MKKLTAFAIFSLLLLLIAACSTEDNTARQQPPAPPLSEDNTEVQQPPEPPLSEKESDLQHPLDAHLSKKDTGDLPHLVEERYVRVLTTINRTDFFLDGAELHGFEYSLLKEYEKFLNRGISRTELLITFEFIPVHRDKLLDDLIAGYGDIAAAGLTITPLREKQVDFTIPYLTDVSELLVTHLDAPPIGSREDLAGKELFVRKSSSYFASITILNSTLKKEGKQPIQIIEADEHLETEEILELVNSGAVKMTVCDSHIAEIWAKVLPDIRVHKDIRFREGGQIAWAVRENNPELKKSLNDFMRAHRKGTLLGNIYFTRYYRNQKWVTNPLKGESAKKVMEYRPFFEKYADKYGFDWRLILAMAFQESGLDHTKRSHRGAVGIMQIKPSTASDPKVGIGNVDSVEDNIHAAVKYLDFLRDRYFSDEAISPKDQVRFSIAAYNAGPLKIRKAIQKAGEMDLNPNSWFRDVEIAVLRIVGQETVRYVSNINKYYVIYNNAFGV